MSFAPTHVAPEGGLRAWSSADGTQPPSATIDAGVPMQILEWSGAWAHILCANDWSAWVDGRLLLPLIAAPAPTAPTAPYPPSPAALMAAPAAATGTGPIAGAAWPLPVSKKGLIGTALVLVSLVLPWVRAGGASIGPFDIPVGVLVDSASGFDLGILVLLLGVALCVPNQQLRLVAAVALAAVVVVFLFRLQRLSWAGPGVLVALAGAAATFPLRLRQGTPGS